MEELVQELQEKLRKSEASRVRLRDSLRQLKERAVDTTRKSEHECASLQKQSTQLRERIKEVEHKQKATVGDVVHLKEQVGKQAAALQSMSQQLSSVSRQQAGCASQQETASLAEQVTRLETLAAASVVACEEARADRDQLWQRLEAMQAQASASQEQQQAAMQQLARWQSAFGAFAREVSGGSPRVRRACGDARLLPADGGVAGEPVGSMQLVPYSSNNSASSGSGSSGRARQAAVVTRKPGDLVRVEELASKGAHASTGTVAGPGEDSFRHTGHDRGTERAVTAGPPPAKRQRLDTAGSGGDEGSNAIRTPTGTVLTPRQHHEPAQAAAAQAASMPASERSPALHRMTPEAEGGSAASGTAVTKAWKCESAAVSIVEGWLGEITSCVEQPVTDALARGAAAGLRDALAAGQCPLSCVVAGFETALLECAAPRGLGCSLADECPGDAASSGSGQAGSVEDIPFSSVWCRREVLQTRCFTGMLACARALGRLLLQARAQQQEGFMEMLLQRLHAAAVRPPPGVHAALHTPACSAAAACAALYRAQGNLQAMRVLVFNLATAETELSARMLPRLAAAVLAWPAALVPGPPHPSDGVLGPAVLAALHDLSSVALHDHGRAADDTVTAAGSVSGTTSATELLPGVSAAAGALLTPAAEKRLPP
ncbi:hypothetical protein WJX75_001431 [Coccomyxa subellipsoidea]|uniref:Uncharacterized protein n=1 Tax=Coccomyxa subellipsoidea TaxID=248742 RepID=A0ABR2YTB6_9CHLO